MTSPTSPARSWIAQDLLDTLEAGDGPIDPHALTAQVSSIKSAALWNARARARETMVDRLRARGLPAADSDALWIGWAGPLTEHTRANLIVHDLARLERLLDDPVNAVRLVIAGQAHDSPGQAAATELDELSTSPRFEGRLLRLPSDDPAATQIIVQGVDLWLHTPSEPDDAATTARRWAAANGALEWVSRASDPADSGWTIEDPAEFDDASGRDAYDARMIYEALEREIVPLYYNWSPAAVPERWVERVRASLRAALTKLAEPS